MDVLIDATHPGYNYIDKDLILLGYLQEWKASRRIQHHLRQAIRTCVRPAVLIILWA